MAEFLQSSSVSRVIAGIISGIKCWVWFA